MKYAVSNSLFPRIFACLVAPLEIVKPWPGSLFASLVANVAVPVPSNVEYGC